jgi:hypothetical protein
VVKEEKERFGESALSAALRTGFTHTRDAFDYRSGSTDRKMQPGVGNAALKSFAQSNTVAARRTNFLYAAHTSR